MGIQEIKLTGALVTHLLLGAAVLCVASFTSGSLRAQVPEPETVFYGRIVNRTSGQEYQVREGSVSWTVSGGGVAPVTITAPIGSFQNGKYSYVLRVPHQAKSLDLAVENGSIPLRPADVDFESGSILVNGAPAVPVSGSVAFAASQPNRGGIHRIDLEVFNPLEDTDGDGIPDWWEDLHGLDKQWNGDAKLRYGENRYTYLEAFRLGLDPQVDDRLPQLLTSELTVSSEGSTGLLLRTVASTSVPGQIVYRLEALPQGGSVVLRTVRPDPKNSHRVLRVGETFTQADVDAGRVEFIHSDPTVTASVLKLEISARNVSGAAITREVAVNVFKPEPVEGRAGVRWASDISTGPAPEQGTALDVWKRRATSAFVEQWAGAERQKDKIAAFLLSRWFDYTVWRGEAELPSRNLSVPSAGLGAKAYASNFLPQFGRARNHLVFAGDGSVRIEGGMGSDILIAGKGNTAMRGNGGPDVFVAGRERTVIEDFKKPEADMLDLSNLLHGVPGALAERVEATTTAGNTQLRIPLGGDDAAIVILRGVQIAQKDLENWRKAGRIFTGDLSGVAEPRNRAPEVKPDEGYVVAGQPVTVAVLSNDSDPDGDALTLESVTPGAGGTAMIEGALVIYSPGPAFAGYDRFSYTVGDGRGGVATGHVTITYPYPAAAGSYQPLVLAEDGTPVGKMSVTLLPSGRFSIKLGLRGAVFTGKGQFDANGAVELTLSSSGRSITMNLNIDLANAAFPLSAQIIEGDLVNQVEDSIAVMNPKSRLPKALKFTMVLEAPEGESVGYGFATVKLARNASVRIAGQLPDGTPFSAATVQQRDGVASWTSVLYRGSGWLRGSWLLIETPESPIGGTTQWARQSEGQGASSGFNRILSTHGSRYVPPTVSAVSVMDFSDAATRSATLSLSDGGSSALMEMPLEFTAADVLQSATGGPLKLKLKRSSGLWSGQVGIDGIDRLVRGVILQNQNQGFGYYLNGLQSGSAKLLPQ